jgi:replicative DNA helicase
VAPTADEVLERFDRLVRAGDLSALAPLPTGFSALDRVLDGGVRPGDFVLIGGAQGVGKTTLTLQIARNFAARGDIACAYVCYEHEDVFLLQRLLGLEGFLARKKSDGHAFTLSELREALAAPGPAGHPDGVGLAELLQKLPNGPAALESVRQHGPRLRLQKASGADTDVAALRRLVRMLKEQHGPRVALFVDYLQKVPVLPAPPTEEDRVTRVVNELKDLALTEDVAIVAITAADRAGLEAQRLRLYHLRGSTALSYESDIVLILNNKYRIVAKNKITYNYHQAQEFRNWVVCSVEKNRSGPDLVDLEFQAHFAHGAFAPHGGHVAEPLIDERIDM